MMEQSTRAERSRVQSEMDRWDVEGVGGDGEAGPGTYDPMKFLLHALTHETAWVRSAVAPGPCAGRFLVAALLGDDGDAVDMPSWSAPGRR